MANRLELLKLRAAQANSAVPRIEAAPVLAAVLFKVSMAVAARRAAPASGAARAGAAPAEAAAGHEEAAADADNYDWKNEILEEWKDGNIGEME